MQSWHDKISNPAQLGGIETAVLDNGAGRGTRIAWINTGAGLRYKVVLDRAMDVADAFYNRHSLTWLSHAGVVPPEPFSDKGTDWLKMFGGGLFVTCGLTHIGAPESDAYGIRGLHGLISNTPAELISVVQPDPLAGKMDMHITGKMKETKVFGPRLELTRTISGTLGKAAIRIHDEVMNRGNTVAPHMLLYHFNFGWPLADEGAEILWKGRWRAPDENSKGIFNKETDFHQCPPALDDHAGTGEAVAYIEVDPDPSGLCTCGLYNERMGFAVTIRFSSRQLPWLTNWQHWGKGEYVTGLEPGTHPVIGQSKAREQGSLILLEPGETRSYDLELAVLDQANEIKAFLNDIKSA